MHRPPARPVADPTSRDRPMTVSAAFPSRSTARLVRTTLVSLLLVSLAGCASTKRDAVTTGSIPARVSMTALDSMTATQLAEAERSVGAAYVRDPKDRDVGLRYASILSMTGKSSQALAVMQQVAIAHPADREVLAAYGKAQAAAGQLDQALATIDRAQTPDHPDWKLYSAQGAVLDQMGRSQEARAKYRLALEAQPNEPSVMSNLGMSYVLSGDLKTAESFMRNAATQPSADSRVRQNLALVVGLQGRFSEAEGIARKELSQQQADANVTYLRSMLSQQNSWSKLAAQDAKPKAASTN